MLSRKFKLIKIYGWIYFIGYVNKILLLVIYRFFRIKYIKTKIYNFDMYLLSYDVGISQTLALYGERELQLKYILDNEIKPGYRIIDLGANLGYYPLVEYQNLAGNGKIYALEPSPDNIKTLKKNIELNKANDLITVYPYAGGEKSGVEKFYLSTHSNVNTM